MDLARVPNEKKLNLCKWYFRGKISYKLIFMLLPLVYMND